METNNDDLNNRTRIFCNTCRNYTIHELVYTHTPEQLNFLDPDSVEETETMFAKLWACRGCQRVTLQEISMDEGGEEIGSEFYPTREKHLLHRKSFLQLNDKLTKIYEETLICYNNESLILCATGLRALLEGVCADKGISGRNLMAKINNLNTLLPGNIVDSLHHFRFIGNNAVHQLTAPSIKDLRSAIEVMEDLLNFLYDLDYKAANLSRKAGGDSGSQQQVQPKTDVIKRILDRTPKLSNGPKTLFRVLYEAGNKGLNYDDIAQQMGRTNSQLSGVLGALGRRINNTTGVEGKPGIIYLLEIVSDADGWGWRMRYELKQVIKNSNYSWAKDWK